MIGVTDRQHRDNQLINAKSPIQMEINAIDSSQTGGLCARVDWVVIIALHVNGLQESTIFKWNEKKQNTQVREGRNSKVLHTYKISIPVWLIPNEDVLDNPDFQLAWVG